jgi:hypothetical protein
MARRILSKIRVFELSAVDRPAQAHAKSVIMKRASGPELIAKWLNGQEDIYEDADAIAAVNYFDKRFFSAEARRRDAKSGIAMKDGSFPIANEEDLRNAERLAGHAKDPAAARAHIRSRAKALGLSTHMEKNEMNAIAKALGLAETATEAEVTAAIAKLAETGKEVETLKAELAKKEKDSKAENERGDTESEKDDKDGTEANPDKQEATPPKLKKALEEAEELKKRNEDMAKRLAVLEDEREQAAFAKRAVALGLPEAHGEVIRKAYAGDTKAITELEGIIKGLTAQVETGKLFAEFGTSKGADATTAESMLKAKADEYQKSQQALGKKCSSAQAWTAIYTSPENADLKKRYDDEFAKRRVA